MNVPRYQIDLAPSAWEDLDRLPCDDATRILKKIRRMENGLVGDIKRMQNSDFGYRLRAGNYRVLFDVVKQQIIVRKIGNRKDVYE